MMLNIVPLRHPSVWLRFIFILPLSVRVSSPTPFVCTRVPPVPLELQRRSWREGCRRWIWSARYSVRRHLAGYRAHGWEALLHLGPWTFPRTSWAAAPPAEEEEKGHCQNASCVYSLICYKFRLFILFYLVCFYLSVGSYQWSPFQVWSWVVAVQWGQRGRALCPGQRGADLSGLMLAW